MYESLMTVRLNLLWSCRRRLLFRTGIVEFKKSSKYISETIIQPQRYKCSKRSRKYNDFIILMTGFAGFAFFSVNILVIDDTAHIGLLKNIKLNVAAFISLPDN